MLKLLPPPMDRAEVLHKPSHAYVVWWKIIPVQNELVNPEHFRKPWQNSTHCSRQTTFQICPLCHSITLRAQRKSVSTSHFWISVGAIRVSEANLRFWAPFRPKSGEFSTHFMIFAYHGCTMVNLGLARSFSSAYAASWGFAYTKPYIYSFLENLSYQFSFGFLIWIFNFSKNSAHIVHGRRPFKFARCPIVLLLQVNNKSAWRVTYDDPCHVWSANFA